MRHLYVLVRTDLTPAQQMVQAVHAAIEAARIDKAGPHPHLVLCQVRSELELLQACHSLEAAGVRCALFREPDLGQQATSLATCALDQSARASLQKLLRKFPLWKG